MNRGERPMPADLGKARSDITLAAVLLLLCGAVAWETLGLPESPYEPLGPAFVPRAVCAGIAALSLVILGRALHELAAARARAPSPAADSAEESRAGRRHRGLAALTFAITCGFVALLQMRVVVFAVLAFVYLAGLAFLLARAERAQSIAILAVAALVAFGSYYVLTGVFTINLR